jgi:acetolactate synthase I/III small subunit
MEKEYTLSVFTENAPGLLHRVTTEFIKRKINIESITASESELKGIHRYTIVVRTNRNTASIIASQLEKQVEVLKSFVHNEKDVIFQEIALYKVPTDSLLKNSQVEQIVRHHYARILAIEKDYVVIEKTGHPSETQNLYTSLEKYGILEFVRSGRVAITKPMKKLTDFIKETESKHH